MPHRNLDAAAIARTIELLCRRVEVRFPDSGLARVCRELYAMTPPTPGAGPPAAGA